jgi:hypothetical protein
LSCSVGTNALRVNYARRRRILRKGKASQRDTANVRSSSSSGLSWEGLRGCCAHNPTAHERDRNPGSLAGIPTLRGALAASGSILELSKGSPTCLARARLGTHFFAGGIVCDSLKYLWSVGRCSEKREQLCVNNDDSKANCYSDSAWEDKRFRIRNFVRGTASFWQMSWRGYPSAKLP